MTLALGCSWPKATWSSSGHFAPDACRRLPWLTRNAFPTSPESSAVRCTAAGQQSERLSRGWAFRCRFWHLFERPARPSARGLASSARRLVVAEAVDNPVNVGSIVRNAAALGWDGLILDHTSADPLSRRSLRVAMGTAFSLPHARTQHLAAELLTLNDFELYALTPDPTARPLDDVQAGSRAAILIGSERSGLSEELVDLSIPVRIPMAAGVDSLNAAAATAVACWALRA